MKNLTAIWSEGNGPVWTCQLTTLENIMIFLEKDIEEIMELHEEEMKDNKL